MFALLVVSIISSIVIVVLITLMTLEYINYHPKDMFAEEDELKETNEPFVMGHTESNSISLRRKRTDKDLKKPTTETDDEFVLKSPNKQSGEKFGEVVTQENKKYIAVAAPGYGRTEETNGSGCVYIYLKTNGRLTKTIFPPKPVPGLAFGTQLTFTDDTLVIGDAKGKVYRVKIS